jgi:menaquinone-9 beta-reductase
MQTHYDAVIIGAGPAGATAAILLARAGWSVAILEKQSFPRRKVCGECIAAPNLALLDALGVGDMFDALAGPELHRVALMCGDESIAAALPSAAGRQYPWGRALGREHLDPLLLERARHAGATVFQPWTARETRGRPGAFECDMRAADSGRTETLTTPVIIAAYGSWNPAPHASGGRQREQHAADLFAFKANFLEARLPHGLLPVLAFNGGYGGMVVGDHGIMTLACCIRRDRLNACRREMREHGAGDAIEAYLRQSCTGVRQALAGARREGSWLGAGPIQPGIRMPRHGGAIFRIGNAAGEAHPIIGEGISMALQSAWLLCACLEPHRAMLLSGGSQRQIQREYAAAWRRHFAHRIRLASVFAHLAMRPAMASRLLPLLRSRPGLLTWAARLSGKVRRAVGEQACQKPRREVRPNARSEV